MSHESLNGCGDLTPSCVFLIEQPIPAGYRAGNAGSAMKSCGASSLTLLGLDAPLVSMSR